MPQNDDGEISDYENKLNAQIQEELDSRGLAGLDWDEIPKKLFAEAEKAAIAIVGSDPDANE